MDRTQTALAFLWLNDVLDEGEFVLLYETTRRKNPIFPYWQYPRFSLHEISNDECRTEFRFDLNELPRLAAAFFWYYFHPRNFKTVVRLCKIM